MNTRDLTKKRARSRDSTESSCSEETEPSKAPTDVLGLGQHLVHELGLNNQRDTLARWMAHHVAELINDAKKGSTPAARSTARKTATETILKIWEHRTSLPGEAYPLAQYKDLLKILVLLQPDGNPFKHFGHHADAKREQLAANLFDNLSRLIICLLLMRVRTGKKSSKMDAAAIKALNRREQQVFKALQQWGQVFVSASKVSGQTRKRQKGTDTSKVKLDEVAVGWIASITTTLAELRTELQKSASSQK
jgi:hypothetical protein